MRSPRPNHIIGACWLIFYRVRLIVRTWLEKVANSSVVERDFKSHIAAKVRATNKGALTHETEGPWPSHFTDSHWWKKARGAGLHSPHTTLEGPNGGSKCVHACKMDVKIAWMLTWHRMDHVSWSPRLIFEKPPLGELGDHKVIL
jgi:hypothetical protein